MCLVGLVGGGCTYTRCTRSLSPTRTLPVQRIHPPALKVHHRRRGHQHPPPPLRLVRALDTRHFRVRERRVVRRREPRRAAAPVQPLPRVPLALGVRVVALGGGGVGLGLVPPRRGADGAVVPGRACVGECGELGLEVGERGRGEGGDEGEGLGSAGAGWGAVGVRWRGGGVWGRRALVWHGEREGQEVGNVAGEGKETWCGEGSRSRHGNIARPKDLCNARRHDAMRSLAPLKRRGTSQVVHRHGYGLSTHPRSTFPPSREAALEHLHNSRKPLPAISSFLCTRRTAARRDAPPCRGHPRPATGRTGA